MIVDAGAADEGHVVDLVNAIACATRPAITALPAALPKVAGDRLPLLGFAPSEREGSGDDDGMVTVFVRQTSPSGDAGGCWHTALLDTMLG